MTTERLPIALDYHGFLYHQVKRNERAAVYAQCADTYAINATHWEVFKIKTVNARAEAERLALRFNRPFNPEDYAEVKEQFPPDSAWGEWAWTYQSLEAAMAKFEELSE